MLKGKRKVFMIGCVQLSILGMIDFASIVSIVSKGVRIMLAKVAAVA